MRHLALYQTCPFCGAQTTAWLDTCPVCQQRLQTPRSLRIRGIMVAVLGGGVCGAIGYIGWWIARVMRHSNDPGATEHFTGTATDAALIFALLAAVFSVGFTLFYAGLWQVIRGRKNVRMIKLTLFWYGLLWVAYFGTVVFDLAERIFG